MRRFTSGRNRRREFCVHAEESWIVGAEAVADAVIAGEIRRGFGGGDDVVGGDGVIGVGHADVDEFAAERFEERDAGFDFGADAGVHAFGEVVLGMPMRRPLMGFVISDA